VRRERDKIEEEIEEEHPGDLRRLTLAGDG